MGLPCLVGKYCFIDINLITNSQNIRVLSMETFLGKMFANWTKIGPMK